MKANKTMERRHAAWMKAHGAPKKMVNEELSEDADEMACGGRVRKRKYADGGSVSAKNDKLATDFLNGPKKPAAQKPDRVKPPKNEDFNDLTPRGNLPGKKYAAGGMVRGDGCATKGKTKGRMC